MDAFKPRGDAPMNSNATFGYRCSMSGMTRATTSRSGAREGLPANPIRISSLTGAFSTAVSGVSEKSKNEGSTETFELNCLTNSANSIEFVMTAAACETENSSERRTTGCR